MRKFLLGSVFALMLAAAPGAVMAGGHESDVYCEKVPGPVLATLQSQGYCLSEVD